MKFTQLPDELVTEILSRVPIKEVGRCKCVCASWRSLIGSPQFRQIYRSRDGGLILYWSETGSTTGEFRFYYSPLNRRLEDGREEFRLLSEVNVGAYSFDDDCQLVSGLVFARRLEAMRIYSVFTGESMSVPEVPEPLPHSSLSGSPSSSSYHLGFDSVSKRYKLLRLIFRGYASDMTTESDIITLNSSGLLSEWRKIDSDDAGICNLPKLCFFEPLVGLFYIRSSYSGDGVICWVSSQGVIVFMVDQETFRWVNLPDDLRESRFMQKMIIPRGQFKENCLALALWVHAEMEEDDGMECFVLEDDEGEKWSKHLVRFPREPGGFALTTLESTDNHCTVKIPEEWRGIYEHHSCQHTVAPSGFCTRLSFLPNSYDHFCFSLDDMLSGRL